MPSRLEQPNLDNAAESHWYFDPGDGRTARSRVHERGARMLDPSLVSKRAGQRSSILAFALSKATFDQAVERLDERGVRHSGVEDRGFMDSIYFDDPLGLLIELRLAPVRTAAVFGYTHVGRPAGGASPFASRAATTTSTSASRRRDRVAVRARGSLWRIARRRTLSLIRRRTMATNTLNILTPSVQPDDRIFVARRTRVRGGRRLGEEEGAGVHREGPRHAHAAPRGG